MRGKTRFDVCIVGGGPAGSTAAIILRQAGLQVCMVDKVDDRARRIGESLPAAAARLLRRLGIDGIGELLDHEEYSVCSANASAWGSDHWSFQDSIRNPEGGGWHVLRHRFDAALRERATELGLTRFRATIAEVFLARSVDDRQSRYHFGFRQSRRDLPNQIEADWVIDATGRTAFISKTLGSVRERLDNQMAAVCWLRARPTDLDDTTRVKSVRDGWWYTSRLSTGERVLSFQGLPERIAELVRSPGEFCASCNTTDLLPRRVGPADIVLGIRAADAGVSRTVSIANPGCLAVGDAALSLDPLSSQGIFFALYSGVRGAEALLRCHRDPAHCSPALAAYEHQVNQVFDGLQSSRRHHYITETRYADHPFWAARHGVTQQIPRPILTTN